MRLAQLHCLFFCTVVFSSSSLLARPAFDLAPLLAPPAKKPTKPTDDLKPLEQGAEGELVEWLQRTLNMQLQPSPKLEIDGKFSEATAAAVKQFQKANQLPITGETTPDVWKELGLLKTTDAPTAESDPKVINHQQMKKRSAIDPDGQPYVTCKAWIICDGKTGEPIWDKRKSKILSVASTTKIMTGYLVVTLAKEKPEVLDEIVTFSERADKTRGSSAKILAGEQLTVGELLYGLMLPSGNDASVALAEHFGDRLYATHVKSNEKMANAYDRFISVMNHQAKLLGMKNTTYKTPHGMDSEGHLSTAEDLSKLAWHAMQNQLFRKLVSTTKHGTRLSSTLGYERNIVWENTNQLLRQEGFFGVKTGTTKNAGACLVSYGSQNGQEFFVVVLGAASPAARYVDSRNLYQWAWRTKREK